MHIITRGLGPKWTPLAKFFAVAGLFGTLCIMNANQLTEAFMTTFTTPEGVASSNFLTSVGGYLGLDNVRTYRLLFGAAIAVIVGVVILGGIKQHCPRGYDYGALYGGPLLPDGALYHHHQYRGRARSVQKHLCRSLQPSRRFRRPLPA